MEAGGNAFFLSRPRRFGKSLLLSTIKAIFEGKRDLFNGSYIENKIDRTAHPVIMLDMSLDTSSMLAIQESIQVQLLGIAKDHGLTLPFHSAATMFRNLIKELTDKTGSQVVVLVDEYLCAHPISDANRGNQGFTDLRIFRVESIRRPDPSPGLRRHLRLYTAGTGKMFR